MELINQLNWRYATKKFNQEKKVSSEDVERIKESIRLTATSYGLQPFKVIQIESKEVRKKLQPLAWGQSQITEASHLFVFANQLQVSDEDVETMMRLKGEINNIDYSNLEGYTTFIQEKMKEKQGEDMIHWTAKQSYLALSSALIACAELKIDATPMEGFETDKVSVLLGLEKEGLGASALLAIGYRHEEDQSQHGKKVRKAPSNLFSVV